MTGQCGVCREKEQVLYGCADCKHHDACYGCSILCDFCRRNYLCWSCSEIQKSQYVTTTAICAPCRARIAETEAKKKAA